MDERASLALNSAAIAGDMEAAKAAIGFGADVNHNHGIALRSAAKGGHLDMIEFLVKSGADIHVMKDEALRAAARNGRENVVKKLLSLGADPDAQEGEALIQASTKGMSGIVSALLSHGANPHFFVDHALRQAAYNGHADVVRLLAENKADLFAMRGSAVELAASEKHAPVVEFLGQEMNRQRELFVGELAEANTREFLRKNYRDTCEPAFVRAVKMSCLEAATARMKQLGDDLSREDLSTLKDREGRSFGAVAAEYGSLKPLFDIDLWHGPVDNVQGAWNDIPAAARTSGGATDEDFAGIVAGYHQRALKEKAGKVKLKF